MSSRKSSNGNGFGASWFAANSNDQGGGSGRLEKLRAARRELLQSFARVTLAMMSLQRYRPLSIGKLSRVLLEPMLRDRVAITADSIETHNKDSALIGIAIWATVSEAVDERIRAQIRSGAFPIELGSSDWTSGDIVWILELIAPSRELRTRVLETVTNQLDVTDLFVHPVVAQMIGRDNIEGVKVQMVNGEKTPTYDDEILDEEWFDDEWFDEGDEEK